MRFLLPLLTACAGGSVSLLPPGGGIMMAYEVSGRVTNDEIACGAGIGDVSVALFDQTGVLLDETRSDAQGHFVVGVRNPDVADSFTAKLDTDDPTAMVTLKVQPADGAERRFQIRLPRPVSAREYRVRLAKKKGCDD